MCEVCLCDLNLSHCNINMSGDLIVPIENFLLHPHKAPRDNRCLPDLMYYCYPNCNIIVLNNRCTNVAMNTQMY